MKDLQGIADWLSYRVVIFTNLASGSAEIVMGNKNGDCRVRYEQSSSDDYDNAPAVRENVSVGG